MSHDYKKDATHEPGFCPTSDKPGLVIHFPAFREKRDFLLAGVKSCNRIPSVAFWDVLLFALYLLAIAAITWRSREPEWGADFALNDRKSRQWPVVYSILSTETSGASLLVFPNLGHNPEFRFQILPMVAGFILGRLLVAWYLVPVFYASGHNSIYTLLRDRVSDQFRGLVSVGYLLSTLLAAGVRLFIASLGLVALYQVLPAGEFSPLVAGVLILSGLTAMVYSLAGGLRVVIRTDNLQFWTIILGSLALLVFGLARLGWQPIPLGSPDFFQWSGPEGFWHTLFTQPRFVPVAFFGGAVLSLASHGADQTLVQRVLSCDSLTSARRSLFWAAALILPLIGFFLLLGFAFAHWPLASGQQHILPAVAGVLGPPFTGLLAIIFLAAAMSSLDSALHSMGTVLNQSRKNNKTRGSQKSGALAGGLALIISGLFFYWVKTRAPESPLISLALGATGMIMGPLAGTYFYLFGPRWAGRKNHRAFSQGHGRVIGSFLIGCALPVGFFIFNHFARPEGQAPLSWLLAILLGFLLAWLGPGLINASSRLRKSRGVL